MVRYSKMPPDLLPTVVTSLKRRIEDGFRFKNDETGLLVRLTCMHIPIISHSLWRSIVCDYVVMICSGRALLLVACHWLCLPHLPQFMLERCFLKRLVQVIHHM